MKYFKSYLPQSNVAIDKQSHIPKKIFMTWHSHQLSDDMYNKYSVMDKK